jgi:C-terminal processing protease CtpA/Prc
VRALLICGLLLLASPFAVTQSRELQLAQLQEDFDVLRRAVEEAHGGLYRFTPKPDLDRAFAAARAKLTPPMTRIAFAAVLSEALAAVRDGHTRLEYDDATVSAMASAPMLPLRVSHESGRYVVTSNDTQSDSTIQPGLELVSINGQPMAAIVAAIEPKLSSDGFIETGRTWRLARGLAQYYWLYVERSSTFTIVAQPKEGRALTATLQGVANADRTKNTNAVNAMMSAAVARLDGARDIVSLSFPNAGAVGLLRIRGFDGAPFVASLDQAFATLREKGSRGLILDLRGNGGGVDEYGAALVSHLVSTPFRYFERIKVTTIEPSFATWKPSTFENLKNGTIPATDGGYLILPKLHPGVGEQKPATTPFLGRLVVLTDGGTFSTAADVCAQLRARTQAVFVGEETGGAAEGNTSGLNAQIVLPNSGLKLKIQMYGYWNALGAPRADARAALSGRGTIPDVTVVRTVADTLAGRDEALERAIAILR